MWLQLVSSLAQMAKGSHLRRSGLRWGRSTQPSGASGRLRTGLCHGMAFGPKSVAVMLFEFGAKIGAIAMLLCGALGVLAVGKISSSQHGTPNLRYSVFDIRYFPCTPHPTRRSLMIFMVLLFRGFRCSGLGSEPVFQVQARNASELGRVVGDQGGPVTQRGARDEVIERADGLS